MFVSEVDDQANYREFFSVILMRKLHTSKYESDGAAIHPENPRRGYDRLLKRICSPACPRPNDRNSKKLLFSAILY